LKNLNFEKLNQFKALKCILTEIIAKIEIPYKKFPKKFEKSKNLNFEKLNQF
jgi:hypothetical protein